jgi:cytochrome c oxidase cbb3-type subunit 3
MRPVVRQLVRLTLVAIFFLPSAIACKREERSFRVPPPQVEMSDNVSYLDSVHPGPTSSDTSSTSIPIDIDRVTGEPDAWRYPHNAQALSDGQTLYSAFNCIGCHANGGGGIGPPLLDNKWFYGSEPKQVYLSILKGRPNGMPSFRGRIPDYQIWELVAYVRSLSGQASSNAAPGREDHMNTILPPNSKPPEKPAKVPEPTTGPTTRHLGAAAHTSTSKPGTEPTTAPTTRQRKGEQ